MRNAIFRKLKTSPEDLPILSLNPQAFSFFLDKHKKKSRSDGQKIIKVEKQIERLEKDIKALDVELEINYEETIAQPNFFDAYQEKKKKLEGLMKEWEDLQD